MQKVQKTNACWQWTAAKDRKGYGKFSMGNYKNPDGTKRNSMVSAHRVSYEMFVGAIPKGEGFHGTCVLHKCDNPSCVNPDHLFLGSNADNVRDMDAKRRRVNKQPKGGAHKNAVLDECQAIEIYRMCMDKVARQKDIAKQFNVCLSTVNHIKTGRLWGHLTGAGK